MPALLETSNLQMRFGGLIATNDVNFAVPTGEMRGIIGPNGAGKTTLVNLITGIHAPTSGDIRLRGESLLGLEPHAIARKGLVRSFQVCRLFGSMSLLDNLLLPWLAHGHKAAGGMPRAREFLELTNLARHADQPARSLSGGQRALLQVAAGFMLPDLACYVLDEPFAGINPVIKETIIALIEQENRARGVTFVIVSHEMAIVRRLCRNVTVMIEGRIAAEGTLDEVASRPEVIAAYLGKAFA